MWLHDSSNHHGPSKGNHSVISAVEFQGSYNVVKAENKSGHEASLWWMSSGLLHVCNSIIVCVLGNIMMLSYSYLFICVSRVHGAHVDIRGKFLGISFLFHHAVLGDQAQVIKLDGKCINLLSYFTGQGKWMILIPAAYRLLKSRCEERCKRLLQRIRPKRNTHLKYNSIISQ